MIRASLLAVVLAGTGAAQVERVQTISATAGGFAGPLADGDRFGVSAAPLDLDGDGRPELAVGAYADGGDEGAVWLLSLHPDGTVAASHKLRLAGAEAGDHVGTALATVGDLDGDGIAELAVGADRDDDGGTDRGAVTLLFLDAAGDVRQSQKISSTTGGLSDGPADGDLFGHSVAALGDVDGDGTPDLAVGGDDADDGGPSRGAVWVLFLNTDGTVRATQRISDTAGGFTGVLDDVDLFGQAVAGPGDLDGDGTPDLAVSATLDDDGGDARGAVWVLFLNADGTVREHQKISDTAGGFAGPLHDGDLFGSSLAAPGDVDGDGTPDLLVGANRDDTDGDNHGTGWLLALRPDGTVRQASRLSAATAGSADAGDEWGPLATLGDLDGDGGEDIVFGSRLDDDGGPNRGAIRVLFTRYAVATDASPQAASRLVVAPNPVRQRGGVQFALAAPAHVAIDVVDALGRRLATLVDGPFGSGLHHVEMDVAGWPGGVYLVRLRTSEGVEARPFVVVR